MFRPQATKLIQISAIDDSRRIFDFYCTADPSPIYNYTSGKLTGQRFILNKMYMLIIQRMQPVSSEGKGGAVGWDRSGQVGISCVR